MTLAVSATDSEFQLPVNAILGQTLLRNAKSCAPYFIGSMPGQIQVQGGSATIKWRRFNTSLDNASGPAPSTTPLSEVTTAAYMQGRTPVTAHHSDVTATCQKFGQFYIFNEEVDVFNSWSTWADKMMETLGILAGRSLNQLQRNVVEGGTEVMAAGAASEGAVAAAVAVSDFRKVNLILNKKSAMAFAPMTSGANFTGTGPLLRSFWGICHPDVAEDISKLAGFREVSTYNSQVEVQMNEFGYIGGAVTGIRFLSTEDASINAQGGAAHVAGFRGATNDDTYTTSVFGMDAFGSVGLGQQYEVRAYKAGEQNQDPIQFITKPLGSGGTSDPFNEISTMAYKLWHAGAALNTNWSRNLITLSNDIGDGVTIG